MSHFFDEELDFLKIASWRKMVITSFEKEIDANPIIKSFFAQKYTIISKKNKSSQKQEEKQEKFFEDRKNR